MISDTNPSQNCPVEIILFVMNYTKYYYILKTLRNITL